MTTNKPKLLAPLLRCPNGPVDARDFNPDAKPGYPNGKDKDGDDLRTELEPLLDDLQERLFAAGPEVPRPRGCCSFCKASTLRARAARSGTSSA